MARQPKIGDIVYYSEVYGKGLEVAPGIITAVKDDGRISLTVFGSNGSVNPKTATFSETPTSHTWCWPAE
jgi:hypothetical protein